MTKLSPILSGISGVHFVVGELSRQGYIASLTSRNTKKIDVLVSNEDATKMVSIQVKTNQGKKNSWMLGESAEKNFTDNLFYIFVNLNDGSVPSYFIVPSKTVAKYVEEDHKNWKMKLGRNNQKHGHSGIRKFNDEKMEYLNRWELLGLDK